MKKILQLILFGVSSPSLFCQEYELKNSTIDVKSSFRAVSVVDDDVAWVGGSKGQVGRSRNGGKDWWFTQVKDFTTLEFRSVYAFDSLTVILANAGAPASILRTTDGGKNWQTVYQNENKEAFFDGLDFWDDKNGMVYGDPINGKMLVVATHDGGSTWSELPDSQRPELKTGEASFAASGTGIRCFDKKKIVITTGGKISRLWTSTDRGLTWNVAVLPIIQDIESAGAFSSVWWKKNGVVVGGDYLHDAQTGKHVFYTTDRGKTWTLPMRPTRGLREAVEYLGNGKLIAIGPQGADLSIDDGMNWKPLSDEKGFHTLRKARNGSLIVVAGDGKIGVIKKK